MVKFLRTLALACILVLAAGAARAADLPQPDQEKRSSIHEVDQKVYLSEDKSLKQMRSECIIQAKRQALESAQSYITAKTKVEKGKLAYDLVWSDVEGAVKVLEMKDFGIENNQYHVWLRVEVTYSLKPKEGRHENEVPGAVATAPAGGTAPAVVPPAASGLLGMRVWTEKRAYRSGEKVTVYMQGNRDFYARVVDITSTGDIVQLLPNRFRKQNLFKAGVTYKVPDASDRFTLGVTPPYGQDHIVVYASEAKQSDIPLQQLDNGLGAYRGARADFEAQTRGISVVPKAGSQAGQSAGEFVEAQWDFETVP